MVLWETSNKQTQNNDIGTRPLDFFLHTRHHPRQRMNNHTAARAELSLHDGSMQSGCFEEAEMSRGCDSHMQNNHVHI